MKACGDWVLITQENTKTASGLTVSDLNIGTIVSGKKFNKGTKVYFNPRNAITIENYLLVTNQDIYVVIE
jgi:hypothetical protein